MLSFIKILLTDHEARALNGVTTTKYFLLGRSPYPSNSNSVPLVFTFTDLISSYKVKSWDWRTDYLWTLLPLLFICWWYKPFHMGYYICKLHGWKLLCFCSFSDCEYWFSPVGFSAKHVCVFALRSWNSFTISISLFNMIGQIFSLITNPWPKL